MGRDEIGDGVMDVSWVRGVQSAEDEEDLSRAVGRGVKERGTGHLEGVFERRVAFGFIFWRSVLGWTDFRYISKMCGWVAGHVTDGDGDAVVHADDAELGDGVLLKELVDEGGDVLQGNNEAIGPHVLLSHGDRHVEDDDEMSDDAPLERRGVFNQPLSFSCLEDLIDGTRDCAILLSDEVPTPVNVKLDIFSKIPSSDASTP